MRARGARGGPGAADGRVAAALDGMGVLTRHLKRRGTGWLAGQADSGRCNRVGWYEGLHVLTAVTPTGAITGYGVAAARTKEQRLAETFLAARHTPQGGLTSVGAMRLRRATRRARRWPTGPGYGRAGACAYAGSSGRCSRRSTCGIRAIRPHTR